MNGFTRLPEFHRLAERELNEAVQYYDAEEPRLGSAFPSGSGPLRAIHPGS
jgi:hypothetical protein